MWMQCAFGVMLGTELIWKKLRSYGKALVVTTLTQSLGTFAVVSLAFGLVFAIVKVPVYLAFVFGGIAARALGKYFGARIGARLTHLPDTVRKYLGLTLLPHFGVSLVFTGIICATLSSAPALSQIVQGIACRALVGIDASLLVFHEGTHHVLGYLEALSLGGGEEFQCH